jgi:hypothetical protein
LILQPLQRSLKTGGLSLGGRLAWSLPRVEYARFKLANSSFQLSYATLVGLRPGQFPVQLVLKPSEHGGQPLLLWSESWRLSHWWSPGVYWRGTRISWWYAGINWRRIRVGW